jgi:tetratricopeptide (TPR) repeat protein
MKLLLCLSLLILTQRGPAWAAEDSTKLIKKGDALDAKLENRQALEIYLEVEKTEPSNAELLHRISREYGLMMDDVSSAAEKRQFGEKALVYANRAVAADGKNAKAQLDTAICYGRLAPLMDSKTKIAYSKLVKQYVEQSLALDPDDDLTYHVLGAWNYEVTNLNPVLRAIARVVYGELPSASYEQAVENFKKAIQLNPRRLANYVELGRTYVAMGKKEEAREELAKGLGMPSREKGDPESKRLAQEALSKL